MRRIEFQASRRATLELELMLDRLVQAARPSFTDDELTALKELLKLDDMTLQTALLARGPAPEGVASELWEKVLRLVAKPAP
ncbi:MAG: succinate dehydrogenase assembly factor 2 [Deltaproteobacteria bacterium]|nr:succinate dehydrogenase assembly factor 2 [Deltaproteobacteria bacterium]MBW2086320.1 succinate dehydrogenase assembly factor 2 [Deltaproteobacteria bacterium]